MLLQMSARCPLLLSFKVVCSSLAVWFILCFLVFHFLHIPDPDLRVTQFLITPRQFKLVASYFKLNDHE